jgi:hypothetical protein
MGPLALHNLQHHPIGSAHVFGSDQPDIFVAGQGGPRRVYLCRWLRNSTGGGPIFAPPVAIKSPFTYPGAILQTDDGQIHAFWIAGESLVLTRFDRDALAFTEVSRIPAGLPRPPHSLALLPEADGSLTALFETDDGTAGPAGDPWSESWRPYDAAGIWTGPMPYRYLTTARLTMLLKGPLVEVRQATNTRRDPRSSHRIPPAHPGRAPAVDGAPDEKCRHERPARVCAPAALRARGSGCRADGRTA